MVKAKMSFPVMATVLLAGVFIFGGLAGAFTYATGKAVIEETSMMMVSHTEYRFSEPGQIIARLVDFQGNPVTVNNCTASILYPDKTFFVQDALMSPSVNISGDYYYGFTTPNGPEGVYEYQATCTYAAGAKTASVTNSFHLSSAFTNVFNNLTQIQNDLVSVNTTLTTGLADLNTSLQTTEQNIINELGAVNSSLYNEMNLINTSLTTYINNSFNDLNASFTTDIQEVVQDISDLSTSIDTQLACGGPGEADICQLIRDVNTSIQTALEAEFDALELNLAGNFSIVTTNQEQMNVTLNNLVTALDEVNTTTTNTYEYVTGTLAGNIDAILTDLGIINATVNRIEANTEEINTTVSDILANQEAEVIMTVFSG